MNGSTDWEYSIGNSVCVCVWVFGCLCAFGFEFEIDTVKHFTKCIYTLRGNALQSFGMLELFDECA